jgi:hypothetical protein
VFLIEKCAKNVTHKACISSFMNSNSTTYSMSLHLLEVAVDTILPFTINIYSSTQLCLIQRRNITFSFKRIRCKYEKISAIIYCNTYTVIV